MFGSKQDGALEKVGGRGCCVYGSDENTFYKCMKFSKNNF